MKKLWLGVVFCLFMVNNAYADRHGHFLRIECNQDLGLLEISSNEIYGAKIGDYFEQGKPIYKYNIDADGEDKSHAEIILINNFAWERDNPFNYTCQLSDTLQYDVVISLLSNEKCAYNGASYVISVIEHSTDKTQTRNRTLFDKISVGCKSVTQKIHLAATDKWSGVDVTFSSFPYYAYFMSHEIEEPLTDELVIKKSKEQSSIEREDEEK